VTLAFNASCPIALLWSKRDKLEKFFLGIEGAFFIRAKQFVLAGLAITKDLHVFLAYLSKIIP